MGSQPHALDLAMLFRLNHDLIITICEEFLAVDVRTLSTLDIACSNRSLRSDLLTVLPVIRCLHHHKPETSGEDPLLKTGKRFTNYLQWIITRDVRIPHLVVRTGHMKLLPKLLQSLPPAKIERIQLADSFQDKLDKNVFLPFLSCFPHLKGVQGWGSIPDRHVEELSHFTLTAIDLRECDKVTSMVLAKVILACSGSLQELKCRGFDEEIMAALMACPAFQRLHVTCGYRSLPLVEQACMQLGARLTVLDIDCAVVNDGIEAEGFVQALLQHCPSLTNVTLQYPLLNPGQIVKSFMTNSRVEHLQLFRTQFRIVGDRSACEVKWYSHPLLHTITEGTRSREFKNDILAHVPICAMNGNLLDSSMLRALADQSGAVLTTFMANLNEQVDDDSMLYVLSRCPNIITLKLSCVRSALITVRSLSQLFHFCPKIVTLQLTGCIKISNAAFFHMMETMQAHHLRSLSVDRFYSKQSSLERALKIIKQFMPKVFLLRIYKTKSKLWMSVSVDHAESDMVKQAEFQIPSVAVDAVVGKNEAEVAIRQEAAIFDGVVDSGWRFNDEDPDEE